MKVSKESFNVPVRYSLTKYFSIKQGHLVDESLLVVQEKDFFDKFR